jgi:hypothetical protein
MNLKNTHKDMRKDHTLLKSDILMLQETWLTEQDIENNIWDSRNILTMLYQEKELFTTEKNSFSMLLISVKKICS